MNGFHRYAIYMVPEGDLFRAGSDWLGWDSEAGKVVSQPDVAGLSAKVRDLTSRPRKYGIHGTVKPPFRLADGHSATDLDAAARTFFASQSPVTIPRMELRAIGRFLAIVPSEPSADLVELAGATVRGLDAFRAPPTEAELSRRRKSRLTNRQEELLLQWGYPYVMDEFRFHITLTGPLDPDTLQTARSALTAHFAPLLQDPVRLSALALMGEDAEGMFHIIHRYTLSG